MGIDNGCSGPISLDEITTNNQTLNAPTLANPSVTGNITLDATATAALCTALTPCIEGSIPTTTTPSGPASGDLSGTYPNPTVKPSVVATAITDSVSTQNAVAAVFKDCSGAARHVGDQLVGCSEFNQSQTTQDQAIADLAQELVNKQNALNDCSGNPLTGNVPTCTQMTTAISTAVAGGTTPTGNAGGDLEGTYPNPTVNPEAVTNTITNTTATQTAIAAVFDNCAGTPLTPRSRLLECSAKGTDIPYLVNGVIPATQLPAYVDEVMEFPTLAGFPATGEAGKIYIAADTGKTYRWNGTGYTEISASAGLTVQDEGSVLTTAATSINFVGTALQATNTGGNVTVTQLDATETQRGVVELATPAETASGLSSALAVTPSGLNSVLYKTASEGITPPTLPPSAGSSLWYTDTTLNETWAWTGTAWVLVQGKGVDEPTSPLVNAPCDGTIFDLYSYTIPRAGRYLVSAYASFTQRGALSTNTFIDFALNISRNLDIIASGNRMMVYTSNGQGGNISVSHTLGIFSAGDIVRMRVSTASGTAGLHYDVPAGSFQCLAV